MSQPLFYFMRHGETDWNVQGRLQGQHDIPLNAVGYGQASTCGEIMRDLLERDGRDPQTFDYVASPLMRARKTMELVRAGLGLDVADYRTDARLAELSFGRWEGLTFAELKRNAGRRAGARHARARQMGFRAARRRELRGPAGARAAMARDGRARHDRGGAWRRRPHPDRAFRHRAAGGRAGAQYRAGRGLSVRAGAAHAIR